MNAPTHRVKVMDTVRFRVSDSIIAFMRCGAKVEECSVALSRPEEIIAFSLLGQFAPWSESSNMEVIKCESAKVTKYKMRKCNNAKVVRKHKVCMNV